MKLLSLLLLLLGFAWAQTETAELTGLLSRPTKISVADVQKLPAEILEVTFQSGQSKEAHTYRGVRLVELLKQDGPQFKEQRKNDKLRKYVVISGKDGYEVIVAWAEIDPEFGNAPILLAWEEDGKLLEGKNGPFRLVVPTDRRGGRYVSGVIKIELRDVDSPPRQ